MSINDWKYYNNAIIPVVAPHEKPDLIPVFEGDVWKLAKKGVPLFARWTSEFDCKDITEWWYCIKDTPFSVEQLNSKKRYEINKGKKNFIVRIIEASNHISEILRIQKNAWENYPKSYRPVFDAEKSKSDIKGWNKYVVFGAFSVENNELHGYAVLEEFEKYVDFKILKVEQEYERLAINAAIVSQICEHYNNRLSESFYISDGERNIIHETAFHEYLIKYFGFRKAYCQLNIKYRFPINWIVGCLYPMRRIFMKYKYNRFFNKVNALLTMEYYRKVK